MTPAMTPAMNPYLALFASRFQLMLQYRAAALAGFATQCWWGAIKVMVLAAFYANAASADAPITLAQAITYTWLAQGFLALMPWNGDPDIGLAARTGAIGLDRLRPIDTYALWYARSLGLMLARAAPRLLLMVLTAGVALPLLSLSAWAMHPPPSIAAAALFAISVTLAALLSAAIMNLINILIAITLSDRGVNTAVGPIVILFSGNLIPLPLFPDWMQTFLFVQPIAGVLDIPYRIYFAQLTGEAAITGMALQAAWTIVFIFIGRALLDRAMAKLQVQGG